MIEIFFRIYVFEYQLFSDVFPVVTATTQCVLQWKSQPHLYQFSERNKSPQYAKYTSAVVNFSVILKECQNNVFCLSKRCLQVLSLGLHLEKTNGSIISLPLKRWPVDDSMTLECQCLSFLAFRFKLCSHLLIDIPIKLTVWFTVLFFTWIDMQVEMELHRCVLFFKL